MGTNLCSFVFRRVLASWHFFYFAGTVHFKTRIRRGGAYFKLRFNLTVNSPYTSCASTAPFFLSFC